MRVIKKVLIILLVISIFNFCVNGLPIVNASGLDEAWAGAETFLNKGDQKTGIFNAQGIYNVLNFVYGIALFIAISFAVIRGTLIGMKIILGTIEERVDAKAMLVPYLWIVAAIAFGGTVLKAILSIIMGVIN